MIPTKKCKICRSTGQKIGLNERCMGHKCALDRRRVRPGQHGKRMKVISQYARELIEKQKIKYYYLLKEKQLRQYIERAQKSQEPAPNALVKELERKLDNIVYLLGFSPSKTGAHQLVAHGHFLVNGKRIKSGNHLVQVGDVIEVRPGSADIKPIKDNGTIGDEPKFDADTPENIKDDVEDEANGSVIYAFLGAGQAGSRIVEAFYKLGYKKVLCINTAENIINSLEIPEKQRIHLDVGNNHINKNMERGELITNEHQQKIWE